METPHRSGFYNSLRLATIQRLQDTFRRTHCEYLPVAMAEHESEAVQ